MRAGTCARSTSSIRTRRPCSALCIPSTRRPTPTDDAGGSIPRPRRASLPTIGLPLRRASPRCFASSWRSTPPRACRRPTCPSPVLMRRTKNEPEAAVPVRPEVESLLPGAACGGSLRDGSCRELLLARRAAPCARGRLRAHHGRARHGQERRAAGSRRSAPQASRGHRLRARPPPAQRLRPRLVMEYASREELLGCLRPLLKAAGNPKLMTAELIGTLCEHAMGNYRALASMGAELLAAATERELAQLDEKLYFELFAQAP